jgi:hypothetical protein
LLFPRHTDYESDDALGEVLGADLTWKLRLVSADEAIAPYLLAGGALRTNEYDQRVDREFSEFVALAGAGCDFLMREDMAITFEGLAFDTQELSGHSAEETGVWVSVGMKYYWE